MICRYKIKFISDIEQKIRKLLVNIAVAPFVGVWIEIPLRFPKQPQKWSLPSWECGLKLPTCGMAHTRIMVAPFVGVWIEITLTHILYVAKDVAPFVGVWIEI